MYTVVVLGRVVELPVVGLHGVGAVDPPLHHDALLFDVVHVPVRNTSSLILSDLISVANPVLHDFLPKDSDTQDRKSWAAH